VSQVFINYRSNDAGWAVHLDNVLSERFGADQVFRASRSIQPGEDFIDRILTAVASSRVLVAVIGPGWITATDRAGGRALDNEHDWVRREIACAFRRKLLVLPLLVDNAAPLGPSDLPDDIAQLARCQYLRVNYRSAPTDTQRVGDELVKLVPELGAHSGRARWRRLAAIGAVLAVLVLLGAAPAVFDRPGQSTPAVSQNPMTPTRSSAQRVPWIALRPTEGNPTEPVQIKGAGFPPNQTVALSISTERGWIDIGSPHTNDFGEFFAVFDPRVMSDGLAAGTHLIGTNANDDPRFHTTAKYTVIE
jgi:hypothetical protein